MSILTLVGAMMLVPMFSFGQRSPSPERHRDEEGRQNNERRMENVLDLTDAQRDQAKEIKMSAAAEILPISNHVNEIRAKLKTLETAKDVDMKLVNKNIDEMARLNAEIHKIRAKSNQEFRAMLTDEQRVTYDTRVLSRKPEDQGARRTNRPSGGRH